VAYLVRYEWAITADDILWRRTKKGLRVAERGREDLGEWLRRREAEVLAPAAGASAGERAP
jgi:glycerol-3-phosphate dehydrogenase